MCSAPAERDAHYVRDASFGRDVRFAREKAEHIIFPRQPAAVGSRGLLRKAGWKVLKIVL